VRHQSASDLPAVRRATSADAPIVAEIWRTGWHDGHSGHVPDELVAVRTDESFDIRAAERVGDTSVAVVDGAVAGFVMVVGDEVEQLYVDRTARGSGVAAVLLDEAERQVADQGYDVAWLAVVTGNARARAFYERQGWVDAGDLPYEVEALGERFVSPCRRYEKGLD
jgi:putative acetyltransferase